jgi:hypothetical protein
MSKNQKVAKYLKEIGNSKNWSSEYLYLMSKTLGFQLWDIKQALKELKRALLNILK